MPDLNSYAGKLLDNNLTPNYNTRCSCGRGIHRDDAFNRRCNGCEHQVHDCICNPKE